jgi:hypothetical protein
MDSASMEQVSSSSNGTSKLDQAQDLKYESLPALHIALRPLVFQFLPVPSRVNPMPVIYYAKDYENAMQQTGDFISGLSTLPKVIGVDIEGASHKLPLSEWKDTPFAGFPVPKTKKNVGYARLLQLSRLDGVTLILDLPSIYQSWNKLSLPSNNNPYSTYLPPSCGRCSGHLK